jgi:hypothetical protein
MAYITVDDVMEEDVKLANPDVIKTSLIQRYINAVSNKVDSYLAPIYVTPFAAPVPALIIDIIMELVMAKCYKKIMLANDTYKSKEAAEMVINATTNLNDLRGVIKDASQPYQPKMYLVGVSLKQGLIRTHTDSLIFIEQEGTGLSLHSNTYDTPPMSNYFNLFEWDGNII